MRRISGTQARTLPAQPGRIAQPGDAEDAARSSVFFRSSSTTNAAPATTVAAIQPEPASGNQAFNPMASAVASAQPTDPTAVQNRQEQKQAFVTNGGDTTTRNPASLQPSASPYQVMAGTIIPAALVTGINSDLPGQVIASVTEAVYDTATGRFLLIPQGSRLIGRYDSQVSFGQRRVLLVWTRLILPDTSSISLDRLPGIDPAGYAGLEDGVDWHWDRILAGAALSTLLGVGAELSAPNNNGSTGGVTVAVRQSAQDTVNQVGQEITKRNMSIQPTLTIRPGFPMRVMVNKDLILRPYQPLFFQRGSSQ
jgi:type IV secretory pathway VirB10-like protein